MLRQQPHIKQFLAAFLLLLFSVCIAPRSFVHDVLAQHVDRSSCEHPVQEEVCLHPAEKHCHFNDPMQTSACMLLSIEEKTSIANSGKRYFFVDHEGVASLPPVAQRDRGPPVVF